ncbi:MAG TPA: NTP transferase domain-containing protein [Candidatus Limnocylindrales bacterium]|nr:NTP transferase domain-containing protein [Candidatus Limnocylindrales bacterium]
MTVAAVILAASTESALADVEGQPRVRRLADAAWSGGALPIVVVAPDPDRSVAAALSGASVTLAEPAPLERGPAAQMARGLRVAAETVRGIDGAFIWPVRMVWVGPETITSLIEAHGIDPSTILRPGYAGEPGWPVLVPIGAMAALEALPPELMPPVIVDELARRLGPVRTIELGDPGTTHDASMARADLPDYVGPSEPAAPHAHEWGAALADTAEDAPLEGPALAPFGQAEDPDAG